MNSFATLSLIYALFTLISSGILYSSFRKKMDDSAAYFLFSELCMGITCVVIFLINRKLVETAPIWTAIPNFSNIAAEISVFFSVASLTRKIEHPNDRLDIRKHVDLRFHYQLCCVQIQAANGLV